ncbi:NAD(+) synthase [Acholeplasma granularum]|uniref:NAD(+) synthase n=1 Tax=Acholeplasma granularum TaxID=264635 RepID=UPI00046F383D|nr:NAD(+) synthase [Acholeplasma granularum]
MTKHGILKVTLASPEIKIGNPLLNVEPILNILNKTQSGLTLFPELTLTGYTAGDLFFQDIFLKQTLEALEKIIHETKYQGIYVLGLPLKIKDSLFNVAVIIQNQKILGVVPKYHLPNSKEFQEKRWFQSGYQSAFDNVSILNQIVPFGDMIFKDKNLDIAFGVEICQDMWAIQSPGNNLALSGAHVILNLSASPEIIGKSNTRKTTVIDASRRQLSTYLYTSSTFSESTTDLVFAPHKIVASLGKLIYEDNLLQATEFVTIDIDIEAIRFQRRIDSTFREEQSLVDDLKEIEVSFTKTDDYEFDYKFNKTPLLPEKEDKEAFKIANEIQVQGLIQKLKHLKTSKIIIGISGGLDSTLALLVAHQAIKRLNRNTLDIIGVTMPSKVTSDHSKSDALKLMQELGITYFEIPISDQVNLHLQSINHSDKTDITYENAQARIRTLILMDLANKYEGFVLGTGDLSEIALGWMTFNGDHMSMYNVNSGLTKTWVQELTLYHSKNDYKFIKNILESILNRPISPELKADQKTEDSVGKYEINDFMIYHLLECGASEEKLSFLVEKTFDLSKEEANLYANRFLNRFYNSQFKRQVMPEGPKVLSISLSPRGDLRIPSDIKRK